VKACVFVGPTLAPGDAAARLDAVYLPPVQQGDVYRAAVRHRPRAIGIVDGYFQHVPSVWHKEILWAMAEGIHVLGSASMGALRAAELAPFGMRGVGRIFEAYRAGVFEPYRDEVFEDEDEVAVVHAPAEAGYAALSEAMVNIRSTLAAAASSGIIGTDTRDRLVRIAKELFYPDRSWERLLRGDGTRRLPEREVEGLRRWLPGGRINQKRDDALAMLAVMRDWLAGDPPATGVTYVFQRSEMWQRAVADAASADDQDGSREVEREALLDELRLDGTYGDARRAGVLRWAGLREGDRQGLVESPEDRQAAEAAFRSRFGTYRRGDIDRWLVENELDESGREQLVADEARLRQLDRTLGPLADAQVVAHLRATGQYPRYASRARAKAQVLAQTGGDPEQVDGLTRFRLTVWYFEHRQGGRIPDDLDEYAASRGFAGTDAFFRALWREYRYLTDGARGEPGTLGAAASRPIEG
jgi:hypothetical protein